jgi:Rps23 Pro-64 3,4-dihydroxylase Tpa1-like proline 4-hydroxylase
MTSQESKLDEETIALRKSIPQHSPCGEKFFTCVNYPFACLFCTSVKDDEDFEIIDPEEHAKSMDLRREERDRRWERLMESQKEAESVRRGWEETRERLRRRHNEEFPRMEEPQRFGERPNRPLFWNPKI